MCAETVITIFPTVRYLKAPPCYLKLHMQAHILYLYSHIFLMFVSLSEDVFVCLLHFVVSVFVFQNANLMFYLLCDEKPFIKRVSCLPVALMGVSCAQRKRGCDCGAF